MEKNLENLKSIKMTASEKEMLFKNMFGKPVPSPYSFYFYVHKFAVVALAIVFVVTGAGFSWAAEGALPGDTLYPLKVNITEPLRDLLKLTPADKAAWAEEKAIRRLDEVQALAAKNKIDENTLNLAAEKFASHNEDFNSAVAALATTSPKAAQDISAKFKQNIKERSKKIEEGTATLASSTPLKSTENSGGQKNQVNSVKSEKMGDKNKEGEGEDGGENQKELIHNFVHKVEQDLN